MREDEKRLFGVADTPAAFLEEDWRETPRPEMLGRLIVALDGAKSEAQEVGDENYVRYADAALLPFLEAELEKTRERRMNEQERRLYDAQANHEAWRLAHEILEPWVRTTRAIGSDELTRVMEKALAEVEAEVNRTLDVLKPLAERGVCE